MLWQRGWGSFARGGRLQVYLGPPFLSSMTHMKDNDLGISGIDCVKYEIRVANGWEHADAGFVGEVTSLRKILEQAGDCLDAVNHRGCRRAIVLVDIGKYVVDV